MRKRRLLAAGLASPLLALMRPGCGAEAAAPAQPLHWVASDLPPYAWREGGVPRGLAYELAVAMGQRLQREARIDYYPWARAVRMLRENADVGLFPLARTPERESDYRWLVPLGRTRITFFAKAGVAIDRLETLRKLRVGIMRGAAAAQSLAALGFTTLVPAADYGDLLRLLDRGIVDAVYAADEMFGFYLRARGEGADAIRPGLSLDTVDLFMVASRQCDEAEAQRWVQAYRELVADGTVARLERSYLTARAR